MDNLQQQLDISNNMLNALDRMISVYSNLSDAINNQTTAITAAVESIQEASERTSNILNQAASMSQNIRLAIQQNVIDQRRVLSQSQQVQNSIISGLNPNAYNNTSEALENSAEQISQGMQNTQGVSRDIKGQRNRERKLKSAVDLNHDLIDDLESATDVAKKSKSILEILISTKNAIITGGAYLLIDIPKMIFNFLKFAASMFTTALSSVTKFALFSMTLPFTIARAFSTIGNKLRQDLAQIKEGGEEAKEAFDLTSRIGKGAVKLTRFVQGSIKEFQTPESRLAKLFGMGAQAGNVLQNEGIKAVASMGHYAEFFGGMILGDSKQVIALIELQRGMGIASNDMAYYAMQAYNEGKNPVSLLLEIKSTIEKVAKNSDLDFKALSKEFHKVRTNIVEFGHLSHNEIGKLVSKLRDMKVKTEDAVNVFKKFTTFEEAAKASAMLFQSFEMNIDAFDLLTARNPAEMLEQFRDAMFQTGKAFKDLNRHEKSLLSSITGISEHGLKSLMNYMDLGLSKEEAQRLIDEQDPTKQQTKMIKGLTSVIKQLQKTLQFNSPFDAFFQGLAANKMNQAKMKSSLISLSEVYQSIRRLGFRLDLRKVTALLKPITNMLSKVNELIISSDFKTMLDTSMKAASSFLNDAAYDLQSSRSGELLMLIKPKVEKLNEEVTGTIATEHNLVNQGVLSFIKSKVDKNNANPLNKEILKELISHKIIESKKKNNELLKHVTVRNVLDVFENMTKAYKDNPKVIKSIESFLEEFHSSLNDNIDAAVSNPKSLLEAADVRTSVGERIDNLYNYVLELYATGKPHFESFLDMGRNVMGTIIKGAMHGMIAMFDIMSGDLNKTLQSIGVKIEGPIKADMLKKGKTPETYSLLDWLNIDVSDTKTITDELDKEGQRFVSLMPTMMSISGTLIKGMTDIFLDFGEAILTGMSEALINYYESLTTDTAKSAMRSAGFNIEAAQAKAAKKQLTGTSMIDVATSLDNIKRDTTINPLGNKDIEDKTMGVYLAYFDKFKSTYDSKSPGYKFLESSNIRSLMNYIKKRDNFVTSEALESLDDADSYKRSQAILEILNTSIDINQSIGNNLTNTTKEFYKKIKDPESFIDSYWDSGNDLDKMKKSHLQKINNLVLKKPSPSSKKSSKIAELLQNNNSQKPIQKQADYLYSEEGDNVLVVTPDHRYIFDSKDAVIFGAKKGGYLNELFIDLSLKISNKYEETTSMLVDLFNLKIEDSNKEIIASNCLIEKVMLEVSSIDSHEDEATKEEITELFDICKDILTLNKNRKVIANNNQIQVLS